MKKSNLIKIFSVLLISIMVMMFSTNVLAANNTNDFSDLTSTLNNTNTNSNKTNTNINMNNINMNNVDMNNINMNNINMNNINKTNNASIYNSTNLPKTGIEDSIPVALLVVVFGISAVYAYKKIKEYRNI